LNEAGFAEGQNVVVEFHSAQDQPERLPALISDLVRRQVRVLVGDTASALSARATTTSTPFVFASGTDPVREGLVASLNRPGGNVTGVSFFSAVLGAKRLEVLRQIAPGAATIGMLVNPGASLVEAERRDVQTAARSVGQQLVILDVNSDRDIEAAFAAFAQGKVGALLVGTGGFLNSKREQIVALAHRHALPACYSQREGVESGGLMSYGTNIADAYRQVGIYAARILKGEKPADLPVVQASKFEFVINRRTAKTLGLDLPDKLLALADEVVE
jgi:putative ABC transport system substrate-binding protein